MRYILLLSLLVASLFVSAQEPTFTWTPAHTKPATQVDVRLMGYEAGGYYVVNKKPASGMEFSPTITIEYFNDKQDRVFTKDITPERIEDYVGVVYFNKVVQMLSARFSKEAGKNVLTAKAINRDGSMGTPIELAVLTAEKLSDRGLFNAAVSPDGNKLVVISQPDYQKDANEKITVSLYEGNFTKKYAIDQTYGYAWTKAVDNTPSVNNGGTVFILKRTDMKGSNNTYSVFTFNGKELREHKIELDGKKKVASIVSAFNDKGDFTAAGYFTEDGKVRIGMGTAIQGEFIKQVDHTGANAMLSVVYPFEKRKDITIKNILFTPGKILLMGEKYFVSSKSRDRDPSKPVSQQDMFAMDYTYYGLDIFIDGFDEAGKNIYQSKVDKDNNSTNDNGTWVSYFAQVIKGKLIVVFNDDKYKYDDKKRIFVIGSPKIVAYTSMDLNTGAVEEATGHFNTGPIGGKGGDMLLRPDVFLKIGENRYLIRAENTKIYRIGTVAF